MTGFRRTFTAFAAVASLTAFCTAGAQARSSRASLVTSTGWLADHLRDPDLVLLHVGDKAEYEKGHIPGARLVSMQDVSVTSHDHDKGLMLELQHADTLRARLAALGISDNSRIVVYYGNDWVSPATRIFLTLDHAGLGARTTLLDGGLPAWKSEGRAVTTDLPVVKPGNLSALKTKPVTVTIDFVREHLTSPGYRIVDGRAPVFYDGIQLGSTRKGHIPGARNIPFTSITDNSLRLKSVEELDALFTKAGIAPGDTVIAYCHIGQQATAVVFAARATGRQVYLFDGSFQEWGRRLDLPVANPSEAKK